MIASDGSGFLYGEVGEAYQQYWSRLLPVVWKDGATGGYNCYSAFDETNQLAISWLSNVNYNDQAVGSYAQAALSGPVPQYQATNVSPSLLQQYVGTYMMTSSFSLAVSISSNSDSNVKSSSSSQPQPLVSYLAIQGTGQQAFSFYAYAPMQYTFASQLTSIYAEVYFLTSLPSSSSSFSANLTTDVANGAPFACLHQQGLDRFCVRGSIITSSQQSWDCEQKTDVFVDLDTRRYCVLDSDAVIL